MPVIASLVNCRIELLEVPQNIQEDMFVLVTLISSKKTGTPIDLQPRGIDRVHAADLRARLAAFAEDWDSPEMEIYDIAIALSHCIKAN
ncbi:MAG: hypothetical protein GY801_27590 [bacterium]|nr:hypothetical protein [bacterium]